MRQFLRLKLTHTHYELHTLLGSHIDVLVYH
jgi:hypothetical protein